MTLYLETADGFKAWTGEAINDVMHSPDIERVWTPEDLAKLGLYAPVDPGIPEGKLVMGVSVQRIDGIITFVYDLQDPPAKTRIPKDFIWRRATDAEGEVMDQMLMAQPARLRRIYDGANYISTQDEFYSILLAGLTQAFGAERAAILLEPIE